MSVLAIESTNTIMPSQLEISAAKATLEKFGDLTKFSESSAFKLMADDKVVVIPQFAIPLLIQLISEMAEGNPVAIAALHEELSTQKAADILNVSRPYLIQLLENDEIPFHKVGSHRRVRLQDLLAYKSKIDTRRLGVLDALAEQAQKLDMGY